MHFIFDLDHTTICAAHRAAFDSDGNGDLSRWIELSTPANIAQDKLLPLGEQWRMLLRKGAFVTVCTSRVISKADIDMLRGHGLGWHCMLSRHTDEPAAQMKLRLLSERYDWRQLCQSAVMFDDDSTVISLLTSKGLRIHNALEINKWLEGRA